jgi:hypothetical protein
VHLPQRIFEGSKQTKQSRVISLVSPIICRIAAFRVVYSPEIKNIENIDENRETCNGHFQSSDFISI